MICQTEDTISSQETQNRHENKHFERREFLRQDTSINHEKVTKDAIKLTVESDQRQTTINSSESESSHATENEYQTKQVQFAL